MFGSMRPSWKCTFSLTINISDLINLFAEYVENTHSTPLISDSGTERPFTDITLPAPELLISILTYQSIFIIAFTKK